MVESQCDGRNFPPKKLRRARQNATKNRIKSVLQSARLESEQSSVGTYTYFVFIFDILDINLTDKDKSSGIGRFDYAIGEPLYPDMEFPNDMTIGELWNTNNEVDIDDSSIVGTPFTLS